MLTTRLGVAVVVGILALIGTPTLLGVGRGNANVHVAPDAGDTTARVAAAAPRAQTVGARVPFTSFDVFLLATGGAAVLVCGANIGRRRQPKQRVPEPRRAQV